MRFYASHGCYDTEQRVGGRFTVDLSYTYNGSQTIITDDVTTAVSYLDVYNIVASEMSLASATIENVASRILSRVFDEFPMIESMEITLAKVAPPLGGDIEKVSVTLQSKR